MAEVSAASSREFPRVLERLLDRLDVKGRFALLKLLSGALRVGVSARLAKTAIAQSFGRAVEEIEEVWHAVAPPYGDMSAISIGSAACCKAISARPSRPASASAAV